MPTGTLPESPVVASQDRELLDVLNVLAALCAGDFSARAEPRQGLTGVVVDGVLLVGGALVLADELHAAVIDASGRSRARG